MLAQRYEFYVLVARTISHSFASLTCEILFLPLEHKIHIFSPPCNILYLFRQEATSALAGFHAGPLSWSNCNLRMLVFMEGGNQPRSKARTNNKLNPHMAPGWNQTQTTLVGGKRSHHHPNSPHHFIGLPWDLSLFLFFFFPCCA